jgi:hypothetical protein
MDDDDKGEHRGEEKGHTNVLIYSAVIPWLF